jgi:apolipoprotein N-acyltransferase
MLKKYIPYMVSLIGGVLYASGFPMATSHSFILGPLLGFLLFNYSLARLTSLTQQLLVALTYSLGFYLFGFYWIPHLLQEFGGLTPPFNYLLGLFFSLLIIPQVYFYVLIKRKLHIKSNLVGIAFFYALLEMLVPQQFPAHLGHTFISLVPQFHLHLAPIFGAPVFSFITALLALAILARSLPHLVLCLLLLVFNFLPLTLQNPADQLPAMTVRIIQPNIGNFLKVDSEKGSTNSLQEVYQSYYDLSTAPSYAPLDLIVWPETSFPSLLSSDMFHNNPEYKTPKLLQDIISKTGAELFIGGYDLKSKSDRFLFQSEFNTAFHFDKTMKLKNVYHKIRLIPFGEGLPFGPFNEFLSKHISNVSFFAAGTEQTLFKLANNTPFVSAICYEILFPQFIRAALYEQKEEPQFLINLTNDSWYGDTAEPAQHLFLAKWRAIEFNLPIIRSTNTGISTVIRANGSQSQTLSIGEKNFLDVNLQFQKRAATPYEKNGYLNFLILVIVLIAGEKILLSRARAGE